MHILSKITEIVTLSHIFKIEIVTLSHVFKFEIMT